MGVKYPFAVPEDLASATDSDLSALLASIRTYAAECATQPPSADVVETLTGCRDLARQITTTLSLRRETAALAADVDAGTQPIEDEPDTDPEGEPDTDPEGEPDTETVTAARRTPTIRDAASRRGPVVVPETVSATSATMHAAADFPGRFSTGQIIDDFSAAAAALADQVDRYPSARGGISTSAGVTSVDTGVLEMRTFTRHGGIQLRRNFGDALSVASGADSGWKKALHAASEARLPGGSLVESVRRMVKAGAPITAAAGWCAPSQPIYDLCSLATLDGLLDLPELVTERGGWQIPANGGPNFASVWAGVGNSGTTHLSEANVISSATKYCYAVPCPSFTDVRLGVDYVCLTGGMLQQRGYPEVVEWFAKQAMMTLPHKINMGVIAAIVAASGAATVIPSDPSGDDAIASLLSGVDLAITDAKYRNRMAINSTLEVVLPMWVLAQLRAAGARRKGPGPEMVGLSDQQIVDWFALRGAVPRFVYDWQDSFSGLATGPGGTTPLTALPLTAQFLIYPAGTWVKAVQPVVSLDTIYDSTKLATNEYTALFVEDGWAALQMCPLSRLYTTPVDPSGVTGCCPLS